MVISKERDHCVSNELLIGWLAHDLLPTCRVDTVSILIALTSLVAATVNGALGYGYASITVPVSLLMVPGRLLNPALVIVELVVNVYTLALGRRSIRRVWSRVAPIIVGILPGTLIGSLVLASISAPWARLVTYATLLPLILIQAMGWRLPVRRPRFTGTSFGVGAGALYALTTISGPPLAMYLKNQTSTEYALDADDFRVALALVRVVEALTTLVAYAALGLLSFDSLRLVPSLAPGIAIGIPLGFVVIRRLDAEVFRRICTSFDAWLVGFGLSRAIAQLDLVPPRWAYQILAITIVVDALLLRAYFTRSARGRRTSRASPTRPEGAACSGDFVASR